MRNTVLIRVLGLAVGFPAPIILALMLNEARRFLQAHHPVDHLHAALLLAGGDRDPGSGDYNQKKRTHIATDDMPDILKVHRNDVIEFGDMWH